MNRFFLCFMMAIFAYLTAHSATRTVDVDELRYTVDDATMQASVTGVTQQYSSAAAELVIPSSIEDNGQEFTVYEISATAFPTTLPSKLVIPGTVTSLPSGWYQGVFSGRSGLKEVVFLPGDMERLPDYTFYETASLEKVTLPENFKIIGKGTFWSCTNLRDIDLTNIEEFGEYAFSGVRALAKIDIPNVRTLSNYAFSYTYYGPQYIKLSDYITVIPSYCFNYCTGISDLDIPDQVEELKSTSFFNCSGLKRIILGLNLKTVASGTSDVWGTIDALEYVVSLPNTPPQSLPQSKTRCPLYVPFGLKAVYTKAWGTKFSDIREIVTIEYNECGGVFLNGRLLKEDTHDDFADEANNITLVARPFEGASLKAIYVNDEDVTEQYLADGGLSLYFRKPTTVRVEFEDGVGSGGNKIPTTLSVLADGHHTVDLSHYVGETPEVNLTPLEGWSLHSVSFNGEDCTPQELPFVTPPLVADKNELVAVYVKNGPSTDISDSLNDDMRLTVNGHKVNISNKDQSQPVTVYDLDGRRVVNTYDSHFEIPASVSVALIKVGERTYKVALR